jgi:hypothetical protein
MTAAVTQRIVNRLQTLPDNSETVIMNFIATIEPEQSVDEEAARRKARADAFLDSFMNVEIDEQAIRDFRERSTI